MKRNVEIPLNDVSAVPYVLSDQNVMTFTLVNIVCKETSFAAIGDEDHFECVWSKTSEDMYDYGRTTALLQSAKEDFNIIDGSAFVFGLGLAGTSMVMAFAFAS